MIVWITSMLLISLMPVPSCCDLKVSWYQKRPGLVWDECLDALPLPLSRCSGHCSGTEFCIGFNFGTNESSQPVCSLCLSPTSKSFTSVSNETLNSMYFNFNPNTEIQVLGYSDYHVVDLPQGLYDGQVIVFETYPTTGDEDMQVFFTENRQFFDPSQPSQPECDLLIHVTFTNPARPYKHTILLSTFSTWSQVWVGPEEHTPVEGFISVGTKTDTIVLVNEDAYTVYVNGKLVNVYPRARRKGLFEIKAIIFTPSFPSVRLSNSP